jgi:hypothetical protein
LQQELVSVVFTFPNINGYKITLGRLTETVRQKAQERLTETATRSLDGTAH